MKNIQKLPFFALLLPYTLCCTVLIGNVRPTNTPADNYTIKKVDSLSSDWYPTQMQHLSDDIENDAKKEADLFFRSRHNGSTIALSTVCKESGTFTPHLETLIEELYSAFKDFKTLKNTSILLSDQPALESIRTGVFEKTPRTIAIAMTVFESCIYDFVLISREENFQKDLQVFRAFLHSFRILK